jgi:hypothetical protein
VISPFPASGHGLARQAPDVVNGEPVPTRTKEVLGYFLRNPQAADNLESVARWRLREEIIRHTVEEISLAIVWLVEHGFLVEEPVTGSEPVFRLNPEMHGEAARYLAE